MLRKMFSYGGMLLLVGAVTLATPGSGWAQRGGGHGGGRGGGGHFGGGHFGGARFGGARVGGARFGGYRGGFYRGGYGGYRGGYGYYPYYGFYDYYPYSYDTYPYAWSSPGYDLGYTGLYTGTSPSYPDGYASAAPPDASYQAYYPSVTTATSPDTVAHLTVTVPAGAQLWFDDTPMKSTGPSREFVTPPLTPGQQYTYSIRARWNQNGQEVTQTQQVEVAAGAYLDVKFPRAPQAAGQVSTSPKG